MAVVSVLLPVSLRGVNSDAVGAALPIRVIKRQRVEQGCSRIPQPTLQLLDDSPVPKTTGKMIVSALEITRTYCLSLLRTSAGVSGPCCETASAAPDLSQWQWTLRLLLPLLQMLLLLLFLSLLLQH